LTSIARRYSTSVAAIMSANGLTNPDFIWVGQRLTVPVCGTPAPTTSRTPTELPTATASPTPTGPTPIPPTDTPTPSPMPTDPCEVSYTVQRGDTLSSIARRFETTVAAIVAANHLASPDFIWVGQKLIIPVCDVPIPSPTPPPGGEKWVDVNLSTQTLIAYQGSTPVLQTLISSGTAQHPSPVGTFYVYLKLVSQDMSGPGYYLPDVPYVMYFYSGYALHGTYWHSSFGQPMSHGCINLPIPEAGWLYEWTPMGAPVVLHY
jgi:LysM repeat protein